MNFKEYEKKAKSTEFHTTKQEKKIFGNLLINPTLGLAGETGEFVDKIKKVFRDKRGKLDKATRELLVSELGDILWYLAKMAGVLGSSLEEVATKNIDKLASRKKRNKIKGEGDTR